MGMTMWEWEGLGNTENNNSAHLYLQAASHPLRHDALIVSPTEHQNAVNTCYTIHNENILCRVQWSTVESNLRRFLHESETRTRQRFAQGWKMASKKPRFLGFLKKT